MAMVMMIRYVIAIDKRHARRTNVVAYHPGITVDRNRRGLPPSLDRLGTLGDPVRGQAVDGAAQEGRPYGIGLGEGRQGRDDFCGCGAGMATPQREQGGLGLGCR
mmetsp:Transcript_10433/g.18315  ORF Transcript_10433/g.18315 Transcript_10433/m.18315 type:complete len:105 (+) Transcript_10433:803-1117(+)